MTTPNAAEQIPQIDAINLSVSGMTCSSCAATVQGGLEKLPGVDDAVVNYATRRATVRPGKDADLATLDKAMRDTIAGLGYEVLTKPASTLAVDGERDADHSAHSDNSDHSGHDMDEHAAHMKADAATIADYRRRFIFAAILTVPLMAISMVPAWQFTGWEWVAAALATPVVWWSGWPFHRRTYLSAKNRATNIDTLVTMGTMAAWVWSTVVLIGHAFGAMASGHIYYETGAVIIAL